MKKLLLLAILISSLSAQSQNYQTVKSNQINYYGTPNLNHILATRTDSFDLAGLDSVFYSYRTIRNNDTASTSDCQYLVGPNWYGEKVIIKNNGENLFFNKDSDTIRIQTQAHFEDTFLVYIYPSGLDSIFATVISEDTMTVLGVLDSLKTIQFFSTAGSFITPSQAAFSKNHGFVNWFASYSFPLPYTGPMGESIINYGGTYSLIGHEFPRVGITKPRVGEIYDFEIGDRFIFTSGTSDLSGNWSSLHTERTVIGKTLYGTDSVYYTYHDSTRQVEYIDGFGYIPTVYGGSTHSHMYVSLLSWNDSLMPEEFNFTNAYGWNYLWQNDCGRLEETSYFPSIGLFNWPANNCVISFDLSFGYMYKPYIVGIGTITEYGQEYGYSNYLTSEVSYYSKVDEDTCGVPSFLGIDDVSQSNQTSFVIYPNPTSGDFNLVIKSESYSNFDLMITDLAGKIVYQETISEDQLTSGITVSTENFERGIYFVNLTDGNVTRTVKLIKQ